MENLSRTFSDLVDISFVKLYAKALPFLDKFTSLKRLKIDSLLPFDMILSIMRKFPNLEVIEAELKGQEQMIQGAKAQTFFQEFPKIKCVSFVLFNEITFEKLSHLDTNLETICCNSLAPWSDEQFSHIFNFAKRVKNLALDGGMSLSGVRLLCGLKHLEKLRIPSLSLEDVAQMKELGACWKNLTSLEVAEMKTNVMQELPLFFPKLRSFRLEYSLLG